MSRWGIAIRTSRLLALGVPDFMRSRFAGVERLATATLATALGQSLFSRLQTVGGLLDTIASRPSKARTMEVVSPPFRVFNNVASVRIVTQPALEDPGVQIRINFKPTLQPDAKVFHQQPRVRVLGRDGRALAHHPLWVGVFPTSLRMDVAFEAGALTDDQGYYQFWNLTAFGGRPSTEYQLVFGCVTFPAPAPPYS